VVQDDLTHGKGVTKGNQTAELRSLKTESYYLEKQHKESYHFRKYKINAAGLKVPKCENFHRTDFFYFFTIKPLWVGDFRAKIKN
jgi:hypothetical protein